MMMERFSFYSRPYAFGGLFAGAVLSALLMQPLRLLPGDGPLPCARFCFTDC